LLRRLSDVLSNILRRSQASIENDWESAFDFHIKAFDAFMKVFKKETNWLIGVMVSLARDLRVLAARADEAKASEGVVANDDDDEGAGGGQSCKDQAGSRLLVCYPICNQDKTDCEPFEAGSKKWGTLPLVNQMLKLFFAIDQVCNPNLNPNTNPNSNPDRNHNHNRSPNPNPSSFGLGPASERRHVPSRKQLRHLLGHVEHG